MRCYHFTNMYMSPIQHGIQSAHAQMELFVKYENDKTNTKPQLFNWAENHKTMIVLNAGYDSSLKEVKTFLDTDLNPYPWSYFNESKEAMDGMLTNVAIVLPEKIYMASQMVRREIAYFQPTPETSNNDFTGQLFNFFLNDGVYDPIMEELYNSFEVDLVFKLNNYRLA